MILLISGLSLVFTPPVLSGQRSTSAAAGNSLTDLSDYGKITVLSHPRPLVLLLCSALRYIWQNLSMKWLDDHVSFTAQ